MKNASSWIAASEPGIMGYPDDLDEPDLCSECDAVLPVERQQDRRMVGYPDEFHDIEVREFRICPECGHRIDEEGGWYE